MEEKKKEKVCHMAPLDSLVQDFFFVETLGFYPTKPLGLHNISVILAASHLILERFAKNYVANYHI